MDKPDSQQRGLAGEYYVASIISRLGYDIGITIRRAKTFDMIAVAPSGKTVNIQVKSTYGSNDWLVREFNSSDNSVVALIRLGKDATQKPKLYFLPGARANELITRKDKPFSNITRKDVEDNGFKDHDFTLIERLLGEELKRGEAPLI